MFIPLLAAASMALAAPQSPHTTPYTFRLYEGTTLFVNNPQGVPFGITLDIRDLNLMANGPRETLFKVYDPHGIPVVREVIPDDGCASANFPDRIGGWDHELQYDANIYAKGTKPTIRWSAWSDPSRLQTIVARTFKHSVAGGIKGVYRIVLAGTPDIYATLHLPSGLKVGYAGHPTFMHGHGNMMQKSYLYVPKGSSGLFFAFAELDEPRSRHFKLTDPHGKILFDGPATGGYVAANDPGRSITTTFTKPADYENRLFTLEVSPGANDFLAKVTFQQPRETFGDYVGMGSSAVFCDDPTTATAIAGGTIVADNLTFWHPFQIRFHQWLKANSPQLTTKMASDLTYIYNGMRYLEVGDNRGSASWSNLAYAMGYYGCDIFRPSWLLLQQPDLPPEANAIIREGLIMAGDRLSFATHIEKVNGNAFAQMNVALWYCHRATADHIQKDIFETFWQRWTTEGWGTGSGLSKSGDAQEHFAHDAHYGSYLLDNWRPSGCTWIKGGTGILADATDDPRFQQVYDRYRNLYSYLYCREANGTPVAATPWSSRTFMHPHRSAANWEGPDCRWQGDPGPDCTVNVNNGGEWFAARRKNYYILTFHGRLAPEWLTRCFPGQLGFSGGTICQLTIPGKGPVLAGTLHESYGQDMDPSLWPTLKIHSLVGETWDGKPLVAAISEHNNPTLTGNTLTSSGEIRGAHLQSTRTYKYNPDSIECSVALAESDYARALSLWSQGRLWSELRQVWELLPIMTLRPDGKTPTSITVHDNSPLTTTGLETTKLRIDRGGFGLTIALPAPTFVKLSPNGHIMIQVAKPTPPGTKPYTPADIDSPQLIPFN